MIFIAGVCCLFPGLISISLAAAGDGRRLHSAWVTHRTSKAACGDPGTFHGSNLATETTILTKETHHVCIFLSLPGSMIPERWHQVQCFSGYVDHWILDGFEYPPVIDYQLVLNINVGIAIINHPFLMVYTSHKNGDEWGMVYYCYANIYCFFNCCGLRSTRGCDHTWMGRNNGSSGVPNMLVSTGVDRAPASLETYIYLNLFHTSMT